MKQIAIHVQNPLDDSEFVEANVEVEPLLAGGTKFRRVYVGERGHYVYGPILIKQEV